MTLHVAKTPETVGLIGKDLLAGPSPGIRIINVARAASSTRLRWPRPCWVGHVGGAALDVFGRRAHDRLAAVRPRPRWWYAHLGASTREAQDKAGDTIAEQVGLALAASSSRSR